MTNKMFVLSANPLFILVFCCLTTSVFTESTTARSADGLTTKRITTIETVTKTITVTTVIPKIITETLGTTEASTSKSSTASISSSSSSSSSSSENRDIYRYDAHFDYKDSWLNKNGYFWRSGTGSLKRPWISMNINKFKEDKDNFDVSFKILTPGITEPPNYGTKKLWPVLLETKSKSKNANFTTLLTRMIIPYVTVQKKFMPLSGLNHGMILYDFTKPFVAEVSVTDRTKKDAPPMLRLRAEVSAKPESKTLVKKAESTTTPKTTTAASSTKASSQTSTTASPEITTTKSGYATTTESSSKTGSSTPIPVTVVTPPPSTTSGSSSSGSSSSGSSSSGATSSSSSGSSTPIPVTVVTPPIIQNSSNPDVGSRNGGKNSSSSNSGSSTPIPVSVSTPPTIQNSSSSSKTDGSSSTKASGSSTPIPVTVVTPPPSTTAESSSSESSSSGATSSSSSGSSTPIPVTVVTPPTVQNSSNSDVGSRNGGKNSSSSNSGSSNSTSANGSSTSGSSSANSGGSNSTSTNGSSTNGSSTSGTTTTSKSDGSNSTTVKGSSTSGSSSSSKKGSSNSTSTTGSSKTGTSSSGSSSSKERDIYRYKAHFKYKKSWITKNPYFWKKAKGSMNRPWIGMNIKKFKADKDNFDVSFRILTPGISEPPNYGPKKLWPVLHETTSRSKNANFTTLLTRVLIPYTTTQKQFMPLNVLNHGMILYDYEKPFMAEVNVTDRTKKDSKPMLRLRAEVSVDPKTKTLVKKKDKSSGASKNKGGGKKDGSKKKGGGKKGGSKNKGADKKGGSTTSKNSPSKSSKNPSEKPSKNPSEKPSKNPSEKPSQNPGSATSPSTKKNSTNPDIGSRNGGKDSSSSNSGSSNSTSTNGSSTSGSSTSSNSGSSNTTSTNGSSTSGSSSANSGGSNSTSTNGSSTSSKSGSSNSTSTNGSSTSGSSQPSKSGGSNSTSTNGSSTGSSTSPKSGSSNSTSTSGSSKTGTSSSGSSSSGSSSSKERDIYRYKAHFKYKNAWITKNPYFWKKAKGSMNRPWIGMNIKKFKADKDNFDVSFRILTPGISEPPNYGPKKLWPVLHETTSKSKNANFTTLLTRVLIPYTTTQKQFMPLNVLNHGMILYDYEKPFMAEVNVTDRTKKDSKPMLRLRAEVSVDPKTKTLVKKKDKSSGASKNKGGGKKDGSKKKGGGKKGGSKSSKNSPSQSSKKPSEKPSKNSGTANGSSTKKNSTNPDIGSRNGGKNSSNSGKSNSTSTNGSSTSTDGSSKSGSSSSSNSGSSNSTSTNGSSTSGSSSSNSGGSNSTSTNGSSTSGSSTSGSSPSSKSGGSNSTSTNGLSTSGSSSSSKERDIYRYKAHFVYKNTWITKNPYFWKKGKGTVNRPWIGMNIKKFKADKDNFDVSFRILTPGISEPPNYGPKKLWPVLHETTSKSKNANFTTLLTRVLIPYTTTQKQFMPLNVLNHGMILYDYEKPFMAEVNVTDRTKKDSKPMLRLRAEVSVDPKTKTLVKKVDKSSGASKNKGGGKKDGSKKKGGGKKGGSKSSKNSPSQSSKNPSEKPSKNSGTANGSSTKKNSTNPDIGSRNGGKNSSNSGKSNSTSTNGSSTSGSSSSSEENIYRYKAHFVYKNTWFNKNPYFRKISNGPLKRPWIGMNIDKFKKDQANFDVSFRILTPGVCDPPNFGTKKLAPVLRETSNRSKNANFTTLLTRMLLPYRTTLKNFLPLNVLNLPVLLFDYYKPFVAEVNVTDRTKKDSKPMLRLQAEVTVEPETKTLIKGSPSSGPSLTCLKKRDIYRYKAHFKYNDTWFNKNEYFRRITKGSLNRPWIGMDIQKFKKDEANFDASFRILTPGVMDPPNFGTKKLAPVLRETTSRSENANFTTLLTRMLLPYTTTLKNFLPLNVLNLPVLLYDYTKPFIAEVNITDRTKKDDPPMLRLQAEVTVEPETKTLVTGNASTTQGVSSASRSGTAISTTTNAPTTTEAITFSQEPATLAPAKGVHGENCVWKPLESEYEYTRVVTNTTWFEWYLENCFPKHIGEVLFYQQVSDHQWTNATVPNNEVEKGCYFLKYYKNGGYVKVLTNATWFSWYINNCFPKYQDIFLPIDPASTTQATTTVAATTPANCVLEEYFPDGNYLKVVTNTTWFEWYMTHCYPKYIGDILPMIPMKDYNMSVPTSTTYKPPNMETTTVSSTKAESEFCGKLNGYVRDGSFNTMTSGKWYTWYLYNCPETKYKCC